MNQHIITSAEPNLWDSILERCGDFDVYHTVAYHRMEELTQGGNAYLIAVATPTSCVAIPLLVRAIPCTQVTAGATRSLVDASSVYGYVGPVMRLGVDGQATLRAFGSWLDEALSQLGVVSVFSRLHPLLEQSPAYQALGGRVEEVGPTAVVDLTISEAAQVSQYRENHVRDIRRARRAGLHVTRDVEWIHYQAFVSLYRETMTRVGAAEAYSFTDDYFDHLRIQLRERYSLFCVADSARIICAALISRCGGIVQYHLGGTADEALRLAPMKLLFDEVRHWAWSSGATWFHLGGGLGAREDSLFSFKAGFSWSRGIFRVWKKIIDQRSYDWLVATAAGLAPATQDYFPEYRSQR